MRLGRNPLHFGALSYLRLSALPIDKQNGCPHNVLMPQHQFATRPCLGRAPVIPAEAGIHRRRGRAPRARRNIVAGPQHFRRIPVAKALRIRCPDRSPPAMNPTTMRQFSTLSTDERRRARGLSPLPLRPHTRSDTAEVGPGALFQSVPFSSVRVLDLARSYTEKSRRAR